MSTYAVLFSKPGNFENFPVCVPLWSKELKVSPIDAELGILKGSPFSYSLLILQHQNHFHVQFNLLPQHKVSKRGFKGQKTPPATCSMDKYAIFYIQMLLFSNRSFWTWNFKAINWLKRLRMLPWVLKCWTFLQR